MAYPEYQHIIGLHPIGIMIKQYTKEALIKGIRQLEDVDTYTTLSKNALLAKSDYTWEQEQEKLINIYDAITTS